MFESVARGVFHEKRQLGERVEPAAFYCPTEVEVWRPLRFEKYVTNYRGPLRKPVQIKPDGGTSFQLHATILVDVCFRVKGRCIPIPAAPDISGNAPHALQEIFIRRLRQHKSKYAPCLGWKEFLPSYFGPFRAPDSSNVAQRLQEDLTIGLPGSLVTTWDAPTNGRYAPVFRELAVYNGVLKFPTYRLVNGRFKFAEATHAA
jgi:CRISPR-associated protein Cas5d